MSGYGNGPDRAIRSHPRESINDPPEGSYEACMESLMAVTAAEVKVWPESLWIPTRWSSSSQEAMGRSGKNLRVGLGVRDTADRSARDGRPSRIRNA